MVMYIRCINKCKMEYTTTSIWEVSSFIPGKPDWIFSLKENYRMIRQFKHTSYIIPLISFFSNISISICTTMRSYCGSVG